MKERLVEDWLTRINERGYQTAFAQSLTSKGFTVLRAGHSPYEHGKDILALAPNGEVHCYQLKDGKIGLGELQKEWGQTCALVETLPEHPSLPAKFKYVPHLVTNDEFTDPALDEIRVRNLDWSRRRYPRLRTIGGRAILRDLMEMAGDFWPTEPHELRRFRELYLADGRGDFNPEKFDGFLTAILGAEPKCRELERRAAAANIFVSYLLGEFYRQGDHWSVIRGWVHCAACIAAAAERTKCRSKLVDQSIDHCRVAAFFAQKLLAAECEDINAFLPKGLEWNEYTRVRNTVSVGIWAAYCLALPDDAPERSKCLATIERFLPEGSLWFFGEGALPFLCSTLWLQEQSGQMEEAKMTMTSLVLSLAERLKAQSTNPILDPYQLPEDVLTTVAKRISDSGTPKRSQANRSWSLYPLVLLLVNRGCRALLEENWRAITEVTFGLFLPKTSACYLEWRCHHGTESSAKLLEPQSWAYLAKQASHPSVKRLPKILRDDAPFKLLFWQVYPHRMHWSIIGSLDFAYGMYAKEA